MRTDLLEWVDADGATVPLTGQPDLDVHWALGVLGRFMPPVSFVEDDVYEQAGARLRSVKVGVREVTLPVTVIGGSEEQVRTRVRSLVRQFNPARGDGTLRSTSPDGTRRDLRCRYVQGMEGKEGRDDFGRDFQRLVLVLRAHDPFWTDTAATEATYTSGPVPTFLSSPFLRSSGLLTSDTVLGEQVITNDGDLDAYPIYTVRGPANSVTITRTDSGERIHFPVALLATDTLVIDTRPFRKTVTVNGANRFADLSLDSSLFTLPPGPTTVTLALPGTTEASYATVSYRRTWLSA